MSTLSRTLEVLQFETANRSFCVDADQVLGIVSLPPHMKEHPTTIPFHGDSILVYPLEEVLELEPKPRFSPPEVIVLRNDSGTYGVSVDWVGEIYKVPVQRSIFRFQDSHRSQVNMFGVWGMATLGSKLALIVEPANLLKDDHETGLQPLDSPDLTHDLSEQTQPSY